jgi:hypothetical protein
MASPLIVSCDDSLLEIRAKIQTRLALGLLDCPGRRERHVSG